MQLRNGEHVLDAYRPTFDPHLDIATVVFSHVQCVKTRHSLALVSKLWRDASKPAAAYPLRFDFDAFPTWLLGAGTLIIDMLDNDEALSLPYERVVGLLGGTGGIRMQLRCFPGECKAAEVDAREQPCLEYTTCSTAARNGHLPALSTCTRTGALGTRTRAFMQPIMEHLPVLKYLHENGCPWDRCTCLFAANHKHWDCLQYAGG